MRHKKNKTFRLRKNILLFNPTPGKIKRRWPTFTWIRNSFGLHSEFESETMAFDNLGCGSGLTSIRIQHLSSLRIRILIHWIYTGMLFGSTFQDKFYFKLFQIYIKIKIEIHL
jgi:hypothetical protein